MEDIPIPKLNYQDFYKFITSFTMITFIIGIIGASLSLNLLYKKIPDWLFWATFWIYIFISSTSMFFFIWAIRKWKINQDKLDSELDAKVGIKILELKTKATEYQNQINQLAKDESPLPKFNIIHNLQKSMVEDGAENRIEKHIKK